MKIVLKLGGSVFSKEKLDIGFVETFVSKVKEWSSEHKLAIVVGGGHISREYGTLGRKFTQDENLLDLIGIFSARLNASLLITALGNLACNEIPRSEDEFLELVEKCSGKIIVAGGFRPKQRTDAVAVEIAKVWGAEVIIKGTDVDYVYDKDPYKFKDAQPIKEISYEYLENLVDVGEYEANKPTIMDRTAAKLLIGEKIKVAIVNGRDLDNIQKVLENKEFIGTKIGF